MKGQARGSLGLTLVEVVVAVLILAIGMIGAAAMQASGLQATRTSQAVQDLNAEARSELDAWRLRLATVTYGEPSEGVCLVRGDFSCVVTINPCKVTGAALDCSTAIGPVAAPVAHHVTVTVAGSSQSISLQTVVLGELK